MVQTSRWFDLPIELRTLVLQHLFLHPISTWPDLHLVSRDFISRCLVCRLTKDARWDIRLLSTKKLVPRTIHVNVRHAQIAAFSFVKHLRIGIGLYNGHYYRLPKASVVESLPNLQSILIDGEGVVLTPGSVCHLRRVRCREGPGVLGMVTTALVDGNSMLADVLDTAYAPCSRYHNTADRPAGMVRCFASLMWPVRVVLEWEVSCVVRGDWKENDDVAVTTIFRLDASRGELVFVIDDEVSAPVTQRGPGWIEQDIPIVYSGR